MRALVFILVCTGAGVDIRRGTCACVGIFAWVAMRTCFRVFYAHVHVRMRRCFFCKCVFMRVRAHARSHVHERMCKVSSCILYTHKIMIMFMIMINL